MLDKGDRRGESAGVLHAPWPSSVAPSTAEAPVRLGATRGRRLRRALVSLGVCAAALWLASASASAASGDRKHTCKSGDTLGAIAAKAGCTIAELKKANSLDSDLIRIGQTLKIPKCRGGSTKPAADEGGAQIVEHIVGPGDTLGGIAERYGSSIKDIKRRNELRKDLIRIGQRLKVRATVPTRGRREFVYTIEAGDTLDEVARRYGMTWPQILKMNPGVKPERLRIGSRLRLLMEGPAKVSKSVGRPNRGKLVDGEQLPKGPGYYRRRPHRAWGTNETITRLLDAIKRVRIKHPKVHDLAIGDLSDEDGGRLAGHKSHQSGRDADIGYYFRKQPKKGPRAFIKATRHPVDFEATWTLLEALCGKSRKGASVEYIFINYKVQKMLYEWAVEEKKASGKVLRHMFQYPRGKHALKGIIRHEPGHDGHMHVRFKCPKGKPGC